MSISTAPVSRCAWGICLQNALDKYFNKFNMQKTISKLVCCSADSRVQLCAYRLQRLQRQKLSVKMMNFKDGNATSCEVGDFSPTAPEATGVNSGAPELTWWESLIRLGNESLGCWLTISCLHQLRVCPLKLVYVYILETASLWPTLPSRLNWRTVLPLSGSSLLKKVPAGS